MSELERMLNESNSLLRSAYQIALRNGEKTNWDAFRGQLKKALDAQKESGLVQYTPSHRTWFARLGSLLIRLGERIAVIGSGKEEAHGR